MTPACTAMPFVTMREIASFIGNRRFCSLPVSRRLSSLLVSTPTNSAHARRPALIQQIRIASDIERSLGCETNGIAGMGSVPFGERFQNLSRPTAVDRKIIVHKKDIAESIGVQFRKFGEHLTDGLMPLLSPLV